MTRTSQVQGQCLGTGTRCGYESRRKYGRYVKITVQMSDQFGVNSDEFQVHVPTISTDFPSYIQRPPPPRHSFSSLAHNPLILNRVNKLKV